MKPTKQTLRKAAAALLVAGFSAPSFAGYICSGKVTNLTLDGNGSLLMSLVQADGTLAFDWVHLCNVNTTANAIEPASCKGVYSQLALAVALNKPVTFWFNYPESTGECSTKRFPSWAPLARGDKDWYFGPMLGN